MGNPVKLWFADFFDDADGSDPEKFFLYRFLRAHFDIALDPVRPDFLLHSCFGDTYRRYDCVKIYFNGEADLPNLSESDYAFTFAPTTDKNCYLPYFALACDTSPLLAPRDVAGFVRAKSKFCNFVYWNRGCRTRNDFFRRLSQYKKVDAAGRLFNNATIPKLADRFAPDEWQSTKIDCLRPYKFTIAFENQSHGHYWTEKIIHPLLAGSVPIYWGSPHIALHRLPLYQTRPQNPLHHQPPLIRTPYTTSPYLSILLATDIGSTTKRMEYGAVWRRRMDSPHLY